MCDIHAPNEYNALQDSFQNIHLEGAFHGIFSGVYFTLEVMGTVTAQDVEMKLMQWQSGELNALSIHEWAEQIYAVDAWEPESDAVNEVLAQLDMMDMNLLMIEDVPTLLKALRSPDFGRILQSHFDTIDIATRKVLLASDPMFAPFCK